jgi:regulator of cell morphogenesis and NO signaling
MIQEAAMASDTRGMRLVETTVFQLASANLHACALLDSAGVHFDEDALQAVADTCRDRALDATTAAELRTLAGDAADVSRTPEPWWALDITCAHVVANHHEPLRITLAQLRQSMRALNGAAGADAAPAAAAARRLDELAAALLSHFAKEENILFPACAALADARRRQTGTPRLPFPSLMHPIRLMEAEHHRVDADLAWLLEFATRYEAPAPLVAEWRTFVRLLKQFASELGAHARFENALLFPRALDLERMLL